MHALRGQGELRGIEATRPLCGIQRGGNRKERLRDYASFPDDFDLSP